MVPAINTAPTMANRLMATPCIVPGLPTAARFAEPAAYAFMAASSSAARCGILRQAVQQ